MAQSQETQGVKVVKKELMDIEVGKYNVMPFEGKMAEICNMRGRAEAHYVRIRSQEGWWWLTVTDGVLHVGRCHEDGSVKIVDHLDPQNGQISLVE